MNTHTVAPPKQDAAYYAKALAMALPAIMLGVQIAGWIFFLPGAMQGHCDFRHLYTAGYMVRTGHRAELYDYDAEESFQNNLVSREAIALPFNHLAYEAWLFAPYSYVPYRSAYFLFLATNIVLLAVALRLMAPWTQSLGNIFVWLPAAMFFTFLPVVAAFMQGQDSILLLLLLSGSFALLSSGRSFGAGILVGLGLFKFQIVILLAVLFLLWRRWRFAGGLALSATAALAASFLLVGSGQMSAYAHSLLFMSVRETALDQIKFNINPIMMPNLRGIIAASLGAFIPFQWTQMLTGLASLAGLLWIAWRGRRRDSTQQFILAVAASALLSYHLIVHDLSILLIPLVAVLGGCIASGQVDSAEAAASALMFSVPALIGLTSARPYVLGFALLLFVAVLGLKNCKQSANGDSNLAGCV